MRIDDDFMSEVGLAEMPAGEKQEFMEHAQNELEVRVGERLGQDLTKEQMNEFLQIQDEEQSRKWLDEHIPGVREIVMDVFEAFKQEIRSEKDQILA